MAWNSPYIKYKIYSPEGLSNPVYYYYWAGTAKALDSSLLSPIVQTPWSKFILPSSLFLMYSASWLYFHSWITVLRVISYAKYEYIEALVKNFRTSSHLVAFWAVWVSCFACIITMLSKISNFHVQLLPRARIPG